MTGVNGYRWRSLRGTIIHLSSARYGVGRGGFSLYHPAVTAARGQLFSVPPRLV